MTDTRTDPPVPKDSAHEALLSLHKLAGTFGDADPGVGPGFGGGRVVNALVALAEAPESEVSMGARLDVLHALAAANFPRFESNADDYTRLAESVAGPNQIAAQTLLDDIKASASGDVDFASTDTAKAVPHAAAAFVGQDLCHTAKVTVDGKPATWIFSEFETDASFEDLADWVNPASWAKRGPMLFKKMELVGGSATPISGIGAGQHWHAEFLEEVQLVDRLKTLLHCDYFSQTGQAVGTTYDLTFSVDHQITVDRGFLLATDLGNGKRRVKVLKIVGFEGAGWDTVARFVCPFWRDWIRTAVKSGTTSEPREPTEIPSDSGSPGGGRSPIPGDEVLDQWVDFFAESAKTYAHLVSGVARKAVSGRYGVSDATRDGARYWSQLAKDWARASAYGFELLQDVAEQGVEVAPTPPDPDSRSRRTPAGAATPRTMAPAMGDAATPLGIDEIAPDDPGATMPAADDSSESTIIPIPDLGDATPTVSTGLVSIEAGSVVIPPSAVTVAVTTVGEGIPAVQVSVATSGTPAGLYVGRLDITGRESIPIQIYVSRAVRTGPR